MAVAGAGRGMVMRLHLVRGSFFSSDSGDDGRPIVMDAEVWSKLPDELVWEVVARLPAAKHFQLHSVSRKWRRLLTTARFHNTLSLMAAATAASRDSSSSSWEAHAKLPVVVGVVPGDASSGRSSSTAVSSGGGNCKVVDIDLPFVPDTFWAPWCGRAYSVEAAGDGLVCISNHNEWRIPPLRAHAHAQQQQGEPMAIGKSRVDRYCVLNPLTRTCVVLPKLPVAFPCWMFTWMPPTRDSITIYNTRGEVARCDLRPAAAAAGRRSWVSQSPVSSCIPPGSRVFCRQGSLVPKRPGGDMCFHWDYDYQLLHLLHAPAAAAGPGGGPAAPSNTLNSPSVALLGLDPTSIGVGGRLVAHRGAVYFVGGLSEPVGGMLLGVWRLGGDGDQGPPAWEGVARMDEREAERLTGVELGFDMSVYNVCGAGELLCCQLLLRRTKLLGVPSFLLGYNLDTGEWDLLLLEHAPPKVHLDLAKPLQLRPELFLS